MKSSVLGGPPAVVAPESGFVSDLIVDDTSVYWTAARNPGDGRIMKIAKTGGAGTALASGLQPPRRLAVDDANVYWTFLPSVPGAGSVMRVAKSGGSPVTIASGRSAPDAIAVDRANIYWSESVLLCPGGCGPGPQSPGVYQLAKSGGAPTMLVSDGLVSAIAVDGTSVYVGGGGIQKVPIGGGPLTTLAMAGLVNGIAIDGANVYWTAEGIPGDVEKVPIGGGKAVTIASSQGQPSGIVVTAASVIWVDPLAPGSVASYQGEAIMRAPK
jgi:hypothetical protein